MPHEADLIIPVGHPAYKQIAAQLKRAAIGQATLDLMAAQKKLEDAVADVYGDDLAQSIAELMEFGVTEAHKLLCEKEQPSRRRRVS